RLHSFFNPTKRRAGSPYSGDGPILFLTISIPRGLVMALRSRTIPVSASVAALLILVLAGMSPTGNPQVLGPQFAAGEPDTTQAAAPSTDEKGAAAPLSIRWRSGEALAERKTSDAVAADLATLTAGKDRRIVVQLDQPVTDPLRAQLDA